MGSSVTQFSVQIGFSRSGRTTGNTLDHCLFIKWDFIPYSSSMPFKDPSLAMYMPAPALVQAASERWLEVVLLAMALALSPPRWSTLLLLAPVAEEVLFRAGLQDALARHLSGRIHAAGFAANAITALAFAAAHLLIRPGPLAGLTLLPALLIGHVYQQRRQLAPCIALHASFNAIWLLSAGAFT